MKKVLKIIAIVILIYLTLTIGIRVVGIRSFKIPTLSMENSIVMGSRILVWKKAFIPKRFDIIVYRNPERDTVSIPYTSQSYYSIIRSIGIVEFNIRYKKEYVPLDKREQWVGRCIGTPGDKIIIKDSKLYVNDQLYTHSGVKKLYILTTNNNARLTDRTLSKFNINPEDLLYQGDNIVLPLSAGQSENLAKIAVINNIQPIILQSDSMDYQIFPYDTILKWNRDNFGEIIVPKEGVPIMLTNYNLPIYQRLITAYEQNKLEIFDDGIYINGIKTDKYTPETDYYFIVNDNRDCSMDSRYWGFLPENHLYGKVIFH